MLRFATVVTITIGLLVGRASLSAQTPPSARVRIKVTGYAQIQFNTTSVDESDTARPGQTAAEIPFSTFETRRVRPAVEISVDDWITGKIEPDFALAALALKDVWMNFAFDPRFQLRIGQFKKPFSRLVLTSSSRILPIERGARIRSLEDALRAASPTTGASIFTSLGNTVLLGEENHMLTTLGYVERELGAAVHGRVGQLGYSAGIFNGTGADRRDTNDGKSFAARVDLRPARETPLVLGAAVSHRELLFTGQLNGRAVTNDDLAGTALELDAEWGEFRRPGLHVLAEAAVGDNLLADESFRAAQGIVAYFRAIEGKRLEGVEWVGRVSWGEPSTERAADTALLLTPGVNLYFEGRNRLMLNWDVFLPGGDRFERAHSLRAQAQFAF